MSVVGPSDVAGADPAPHPLADGAGLTEPRRDLALVPVDSAASRALIGVIAILTFLAAICAGAAEIVAASSAQWQASVAREATIQVRPTAQRDVEADVAKASELARRAAGVTDVRALSKAEAGRLLEPWLGSDLALDELPVPRLIVVKVEDRGRVDLRPLKQALAAEVPSASLDDHALWLARLSTMANTIVGIGLAVVALVFVAAGLAVAFATRGAMAGNREIVEVLHFVGADDDFIAREFQKRFFRLGLKGGAAGGGAALAVLAGLGLFTMGFGSNPAGDQIEALFGSFELGWRGYASIVAIACLVSGLTAAVSRLAVRHFLSGTAT